MHRSKTVCSIAKNHQSSSLASFLRTDSTDTIVSPDYGYDLSLDYDKIYGTPSYLGQP